MQNLNISRFKLSRFRNADMPELKLSNDSLKSLLASLSDASRFSRSLETFSFEILFKRKTKRNKEMTLERMLFSSVGTQHVDYQPREKLFVLFSERLRESSQSRFDRGP